MGEMNKRCMGIGEDSGKNKYIAVANKFEEAIRQSLIKGKSNREADFRLHDKQYERAGLSFSTIEKVEGKNQYVLKIGVIFDGKGMSFIEHKYTITELGITLGSGKIKIDCGGESEQYLKTLKKIFSKMIKEKTSLLDLMGGRKKYVFA